MLDSIDDNNNNSDNVAMRKNFENDNKQSKQTSTMPSCSGPDPGTKVTEKIAQNDRLHAMDISS